MPIEPLEARRIEEPANASDEVMFARQAIFDRQLNVSGYELLFREHPDRLMGRQDGTAKTASLIFDSIATWGQAKITGGRPAHINFTTWLLLSDIPSMLDPGRTVIELVGEVEATESVLGACRVLRERGFRVALDNVRDSARVEPFRDVIDIVKVDFGILGPNARERIAGELISEARYELIAEKVQSPADFQQAVDLGFDRFQGVFLDRPELVTHRRIRGFRPHYIRMLAAVSCREIDFDEVADAVKSELSLSHHMLRLAGSAAAHQMSQVHSVREALVLLGERALHRAAMLTTVADLGSEVPVQLAVDSAIRARFCESLATAGLAEKPFDLFFLGMLSKIDALLDIPMADAVEGLPISDALTLALVDRAGRLGDVLMFVEAYERGDSSAVERAITQLGVDETQVGRCYREALAWAGEAFGSEPARR